MLVVLLIVGGVIPKNLRRAVPALPVLVLSLGDGGFGDWGFCGRVGVS